MPNPLHILVAALGSHGDVHPFIAICRALQRRGHHVTFIAPAVYASLAAQTGVDFEPIGTAEQFQRLTSDPDLWHPIKAFGAMARGISEVTEPYFRAVQRLATPSSVLVFSTIALGARVAQEKLKIRAVSVHLSPGIFRSCINPAHLPPLPVSPRWPAWVNRFLLNSADRFMVDPLIGPALNRFRGSLGLPPVRAIMRDWLNSPDRVIGLFPAWFGPPAIDWPRQTIVTGFPLYDEADIVSLPDDLLKFLDTGENPIAFTPGSAMRYGEKFFRTAVDACARLGRRGLLLTRHREHLPASMPGHMLRVDFAPFSLLLPRCAALVHHGGIGTLSQALAAGVPQLITPMAHDQPDNAFRAKNLGVAKVIPARRFTPRRAEAALAEALYSSQIAARCVQIKARIASDPTLDVTAQTIEETANR